MKLKAFIKKYLNWIVAVLLIAYCVDLYFELYANNKQTTKSKYDDYHITDTASQNELNYDSMPCKMIQFAKDSIKRIKNEQIHVNDGDDAQGEVRGGEFLWGLAYVSNNYKHQKNIHLDSPFDYFLPLEKQDSNTHYFISIYPYEFPDNNDNSDYFISQKHFIAQNNKYYLKYVVKDSVNGRDFYGHYIYREIPVKYVEKYKTLLMPVTFKNYSTACVLLNILRNVFTLCSFYFFLILPIKVILSISKGTPFDYKNIRRLSFIAYFLLLFPFLLSAIKLIIHQMFLQKIPKEFTFHLQLYFDSYFNFMLAGVVVFIIARAFKRGYNLQKEQELTI